MSFSVSDARYGVREPPSSPGMDQHRAGDGLGEPPGAQQILDALSAHIAVLDQSGRIIAVNQAWSQFAADNDGVPEQTGVGVNYLEVCQQASGKECEDATATLAGLKSVLDGSQHEFRLEYPCHSPTEGRWFLLHASPLSHAASGIVMTHHGITERKLAELAVQTTAAELARSNELLLRLAAEREELAQSREQAFQELETADQELKGTLSQLVQAEKLSALGQVVAGVAHEINNPLAFVTNNLYLLRRDLQGMTELVALYETCHEALAEHDPALLGRILEVRDRIELGFVLESLDDMMSRTAHGLKRIHQIVAGLRNFARLDEAELKEADVNEGIIATVNIMRLKARELGIRLELDLKPLPPLLCYPGKVNQVVLNLVANAIDASAEGGTVSVRTSPLADGVEIHVVDEGAGIAPSIRDRIFDPFFTTKAVGKGTGLGLSIGSSIVEAHGGRLGVESRPGKGSHFTVWLPFQSPLAGS